MTPTLAPRQSDVHMCQAPPIVFDGQVYQCPVCETYYEGDAESFPDQQAWHRMTWLRRWLRRLV